VPKSFCFKGREWTKAGKTRVFGLIVTGEVEKMGKEKGGIKKGKRREGNA